MVLQLRSGRGKASRLCPCDCIKWPSVASERLHTLYSRLNDKRHGAIVIIMQRLHEDDLVGHVLGQEQWEILSFPAIAEKDEEHRIEMILEPRCFSRRQGEALHPDREPLEVLDRIRRTIGNTTSPASTSNRQPP